MQRKLGIIFFDFQEGFNDNQDALRMGTKFTNAYLVDLEVATLPYFGTSYPNTKKWMIFIKEIEKNIRFTSSRDEN